jgi:hypothetical protein
VSLNLAAGHPAGVHGDDLVIKAVEACLPLLDKLRLELRRPVARHINLHLPALTFDCLGGLTVTRVASVLACRVVLLITEMMSHLALQRTFDHRFSELLILLANHHPSDGANFAK